ncbi:alpha/beta fold hydrolase [Actinoplanes solisilvae]|uniref:alpha/beta fold hydrolase n=1 Tax=Actinoplanes solisilvae TaxID=2486853 RepID=UPI000FDBCC4A|nr:alpha/beta hydrolase [Actinoplanes solisilvae]
MNPLTPGTHEIDVDGVRQVYHVFGSGPVCVALSGGPGIVWEYLRSPGLEQHFTMVHPEPVGTGDSGRLPASEYTMDTYVRFLHVVIEHLGSAPVRLLGHSYGGFVAQRYTLTHPERVAGLALYDTSPVTGADFWGAAMAQLAAYPERHPDVPEAAQVPAAFQRLGAATTDAELTAALKEAVPVYFADFWQHRAELAPFVAGIRIWADPANANDPAPFDVRDRLPEITVPTAILVGRHDFICGPTWAKLLAEGIPAAHLTEFPDSGHFPHVEEPEAFVAAVTSTLSN